MMKYTVFAAALMIAPPAAAQSWGDLDGLIVSQLTGQELLASAFMPDHADPGVATRAVVIARTHIPGSAGNFANHIGYFVKQNGTWALARRFEGLYGYGNHDPVFSGTFFEVTTDTLGPSDPRCCPTQKTRWRIDLTTGQVVPLK